MLTIDSVALDKVNAAAQALQAFIDAVKAGNLPATPAEGLDEANRLEMEFIIALNEFIASIQRDARSITDALPETRAALVKAMPALQDTTPSGTSSGSNTTA